REAICEATVAKQPGHWGERVISRKPSRREGRIVSANLWRLRSCAFFFACEAAGASSTRLSLRPLFSLARRIACTTRARSRLESADACVGRHCEERTRRSNPFFLYAAVWIASLASQ